MRWGSRTRLVGIAVLALTGALVVGFAPARAGVGPSRACEDGTPPPGGTDTSPFLRGPITVGAGAGSNPADTVYVDLCFSNTEYDTPGTVGGFISARIQAHQTAPNVYQVGASFVCTPDTNSIWPICDNAAGVFVTQNDPNPSSIGNTFSTTLYVPGTSLPIGQTGAEIGTLGGTPPGTTGQSLNGTCFWVAGIPVPGCGSSSSVAVATGDLVPTAGLTPGGCVVSLGSGCLVSVPAGVKIQAFRDTTNNTVSVSLLGVSESRDPTGNQTLCVAYPPNCP